MKKAQGNAAEQAQRSDIIRKKQDELYAANQKYEKQVRELTAQLETAQKDAKDLQKAVDDKADDIFVLETERDAARKERDAARKEIESIAKEIRIIGSELKEQKEAYAALQYTGSDYSKKLKGAQDKCAAELTAAKADLNKQLKDETLKIYKNTQEQVAKIKENSEAASKKAMTEANAIKQSAVSFATSLMRQKEIKPKDIQDLLDILQTR